MPVESSTTSRAVLSPNVNRILAHHVPQGRSNDCGPYSAAMLINTLCSQKVDPSNLARELDHIRWIGPLPFVRRIPNWATFPWGVADALRLRGIPAHWRPFGSPAALVRTLHSGSIPIVFIGSFKPMWGHVMVLLARDPIRGWGFSDPAWPSPELHWLPDSTFLSQWRTYANSWVEVKPEVQSISKVTGQ
jgi:hypothetical protein